MHGSERPKHATWRSNLEIILFYHSAQKSLVRAFSRSKRVSGEPRENTIFLYVLDEVQTPAFLCNSIACHLMFLGKNSYISCSVLKYQLDEVDVHHSIHPGLSTTSPNGLQFLLALLRQPQQV